MKRGLNGRRASFQGPGAPPGPKPASEPNALTPTREAQLKAFIRGVGERIPLRPAGLIDTAPPGVRSSCVGWGFTNAGEITQPAQWGSTYLGQLLIGPSSVTTPFNREVWKGRGGVALQVNGREGWGIAHRPSGGVTAISINGNRIRTAGTVSWNAVVFAVMWERDGWALASVMQRFFKGNGSAEGNAAMVEQVKAEALQHAELLDKAMGSSAPTSLEIELLDVNPVFCLPNVKLPFAREQDPLQDQSMMKISAYRKGAATDGVSLLLLRVRLEKPGTVTFTLEGQADPGGLYPVNGKPFAAGPGPRTLEVKSRNVPLSDGATHPCVFALYRPPDTTWSGGEANRQVMLRAKFSIGARAAGTAERSILLMRPPVVLVHGTYDNPENCWAKPLSYSDGRLGPTMYDRLTKEGLSVFMLDWEKTNGERDPSDFVTNERTVLQGPGGIAAAVAHLRAQGFASTQADLVCHSQGGDIARVYIKGVRSDQPRSSSDPHYTNPDNCHCWYHTDSANPSFHRGTVHRLITLCTTHKGSDICRLFSAYQHAERQFFAGKVSPLDVAITASLLGIAHIKSGIFTGGFRDQIPGSRALRALGRTPVPSHAVACVAEDVDLMTVLEDPKGGKVADAPFVTLDDRGKKRYPDGYYQGRLALIWGMSEERVLREAFGFLNQAKDAEALIVGKRRQAERERLSMTASPTEAVSQGNLAEAEKWRNIGKLRAAAFNHEPNDCTVSQSSALAGLKEPFTTVMKGMLHGYATRYPAMQDLVANLLTNPKGRFAPLGFPDAYAGLPYDDKIPPPRVPDTPRSPTDKSASGGTKPSNEKRTVPKGKDALLAKVTSGDPVELPGVPATGTKDAAAVPGFGAILTVRGGEVSVAGLVPGDPAEKAGLKAGDVLLSVNGKSVKGLPARQVADLLKETADSILSIKRGVKTLSISVSRGEGPEPDGLGVRFRTGTGDPVVVGITPETPAEAIGLKPGDRILTINGKKVVGLTVEQLKKLFEEMLTQGGKLTVGRGDEVKTLGVQ